jgi:hypothetical protein
MNKDKGIPTKRSNKRPGRQVYKSESTNNNTTCNYTPVI